MNKDESQLIWEQYTEQAKTNKKPDKDGDDVPDWADKKPGENDHAEKDEDTVNERISPEDKQRMKDADTSRDAKARQKLRRQLQRKHHPDMGGDVEDSKDVNVWHDQGIQVKEGTWHIGPHEAAQKFYKYVIDNAETYMNAFEKVKTWKQSWGDRLRDIGGEAFGDDTLYDNIEEFIENPRDSSLHALRRSAEVALGLTKKREREDAQSINEAKPGSALDMLGLEPDDFGHDDPDQAAFDRMDDDSPFGDLDDAPTGLDSRPAADDHAETLMDVVKMLEDKHFDYTFNVENQTIKMKSDKGDEYILKVVGTSGAHDTPVSLR